jgi:pSer/pThr/pTyr-binding forkhead associated (FHA) protein
MIWSLLLFLLKFVLIGLVFWVVLMLLRTVREEMFQRLESRVQEAYIVPGRLKVVDPGGDTRTRPGQEIPLKPETGLGAEPDNAVILNDPYVSGHHTRLLWDGAGWWIEDLGSRNGTFLNQSQLPPHAPQTIAPGAWIQVGGMTFTLVVE